MKIKLFLFLILFPLSQLCLFGQTLIKDQPESGNKINCASFRVHLKPGYSFIPEGSESMEANISSECGPFFIVDTRDILDVVSFQINGAGLSGSYTSDDEYTFSPIVAYGTTDTIEINLINADTITIATIFVEINNQINLVSSRLSIEENGIFRLYETDNFLNQDIEANLSLNLTALHTNLLYKGCVNENNVNWVSTTTYNENGFVIAESKSYLDDIGRSLQSQYRNFSTSKIMANQNIYDYFGRTVISTLSAPLYQGYFCYKPEFITANSGQPYDFTKFDLSNTSSVNLGEKNNPFGVDQTDKGSLGWYYSNNNDEEPYVAASAFPYTRVEYYNDPLGRPKKTAGLTEVFKMGSGHESQVFYGKAGFEFEYVYQSSSKGISKTITKNADGLEQVTYTDGLGKVRATAYSGIDNDCMSIPVKYELPYYEGRSVDVHVPGGEVLKWYVNIEFSCILSYSGTDIEDYVTIKIYDLVTEKELIKGTDYVLNSNKTFSFLGSYSNKTLFLRVSYDYTEDYIGSGGAYYGYGSCQGNSGILYPSQSFGTTLNYSHWTLNYYDEKGNLIKSIPPEGVDCNGINPSIEYASEYESNNYAVYNSSSYPMDPAYFGSYDPFVSSIYTSPTTQEQSVKLKLFTRQYAIPFDPTAPCGSSNPLPWDISALRQAPTDMAEMHYLTNKALMQQNTSTDFSSSNLISSSLIADSLRAVSKSSKLQQEIDEFENQIDTNVALRQSILNTIDEIEDIINDIPLDSSDIRIYQSEEVTVEELDSLIQKLTFEAARLLSENTDLEELIADNDTLKTIVEQEDYYPIEPVFTQKPLFVEDGVLVGETGEAVFGEVNPCTYHCTNGIMDCGETATDVGPDCVPPVTCDKFRQGTFNFNIEIILSNGTTNMYLLQDGSVTSTPTSFPIFVRLYKDCRCRYLWDMTSLSTISPDLISDEILATHVGSSGEIKYNLKSIWVARSGNNYYPFNSSDDLHKFAQYINFDTYATQQVGPKTDDNISHSLADTYEYDVLNQLVAETTPDKGLMEHVFDSRGRIRFDQNAQQKIDNKFGYVNYDRAGRPIETGVYNYTSGTALQFQNYNEEPVLSSGTSVLTVLDEYDGLDNTYCSEQTYMSYDVADNSSSPYYPFSTAPYTTYKQKNLLGRVAKTCNENSITWYSYDMYGRAEWTIEYIIDANVADYKTIHYQYDASGNLVKTIYQKDDTEYFEHKNTFDAGQQITKVETSTNGVDYTQQASYDYYQHGALKRTELGDKLQGVDYIYTVDGKLKAINSPNLGSTANDEFVDPGNDDLAANGVNTDVFGMTIDYYEQDYKRYATNINYGLGTNQKYSGTINQVRWNLAAPSLTTDLSSQGDQNAYLYQYNEFNWLTEAIFGVYEPTCTHNNGSHCVSSTATFTADAENLFKVSGITYDKNGNIETLIRNGNTTTGMDNLTYHYATTTQSEDADVVKINNQLNYVADAVSSSGFVTDITNQSTANYTYNAIGELIADAIETQTYTYYQNGLEKEVYDGANLQLKFLYNTQGKRLKKEIYSSGTLVKEVFYFRDLSGAVVCVYETDVVASTTVKDYTLFGLNQLGLYDPATAESRYHLYDHLGNVRATIRENAGALEVLSASDYYPFGGVLPGRSLLSSLNKLNFGYQGKELDQNGFYDFEARQYDARLGRWITTDPASQFYSPYLAMGNNPMMFVDPNGEFAWFIPVIAFAAAGAYTGAAIQQGTGGLSGANWNPFGGAQGAWNSDWWKGATVGGIIGAGIGLGVSAGVAAFGANVTGISVAGQVGFASSGATTAAWNITANALITANINMASSAFQGGDWGQIANTGLVGLVSGAIGGGVASLSKYSSAASSGAMTLEGIKTQNFVTNILNGSGDRLVRGLNEGLSTEDLIKNTIAGGFEGFVSAKMLSSDKLVNLGRNLNVIRNPVAGRYITSFLTNSLTSNPGGALMASRIYASIYPTWKLGVMNNDLSISLTTSMSISPFIYGVLSSFQNSLLPNYPYAYGLFKP